VKGRVKPDEAAWRAGYAAGVAGERGIRAPLTLESLSWASGYIEGDAHRKRGFMPPRLAEPGPAN
jgi:hypothetical protein